MRAYDFPPDECENVNVLVVNANIGVYMGPLSKTKSQTSCAVDDRHTRCSMFKTENNP